MRLRCACGDITERVQYFSENNVKCHRVPMGSVDVPVAPAPSAVRDKITAS